MKKITFVLGALAIVFCAWLFTLSSQAPYQRNWWKPHRWMSAELKNKTAIKNTFITVPISETEFYDFDICLEHGELRRIDPPK